MVLAVAVVTAVLGAAVLKPWETSRTPERAAATPLAGASGALLPATTSGPAAAPPAAAAPIRPSLQGPFIAGLNLAVMGTADPHRGWGVAVAYVPRNQIDAVVGRGDPAITPVVSWELIEPGRRPPGPTLDHADVINVAIAATWPIGMQPRSIRLWSSPAVGPNPSAHSSPSTTPAHAVGLGTSLAAQVQAAAGEPVGALIEPGDFYLPPATRTDAPGGWIGNGWPAGPYALEVVTDDGARTILPFTLASDGS
jgi:hypothetical protein